MQSFRQNLLTAGLAVDPGIIATGIMRPDITVKQILTLPLFVNAFQKQNASKEEHRRKLRAEMMQENATEGKAKKQRELYTCPGLPGSGEEASQLLGLAFTTFVYRGGIPSFPRK